MKLLTRLALVLGFLFGTVVMTGSPAHAAYGNSAWCSSTNKWYIHGPFPVGGGMWSWATSVSWYTTAPPQDYLVPCTGMRIDQVVLQYWNGSWVNGGVNYESNRFVAQDTNTVIAAAGGCMSGVAYRTWIHGYDPVSTAEVNYFTAYYYPC